MRVVVVVIPQQQFQTKTHKSIGQRTKASSFLFMTNIDISSFSQLVKEWNREAKWRKRGEKANREFHPRTVCRFAVSLSAGRKPIVLRFVETPTQRAPEERGECGGVAYDAKVGTN
ncbi:unnamed protein product [Caenorhabditis brenneri]